ncbi:caspase family protein [candidate division KSB1 bacterium]|nr:caspase family protein [candidate division KSB1 bacterium]MBL7095901.1 caspase family protein [candidate division KSB1 bacterium]
MRQIQAFLIIFVLLLPIQIFAQQKTINSYNTRGVNIFRKTVQGERFLDYNDSWAILIGINDYKYHSDLNYAVNDVEAVKSLLIENYGFEKNKIKVCNLNNYFSQNPNSKIA